MNWPLEKLVLQTKRGQICFIIAPCYTFKIYFQSSFSFYICNIVWGPRNATFYYKASGVCGNVAARMHTYVGAIFESSTQSLFITSPHMWALFFCEHVSMKMKALTCLSTASQGCQHGCRLGFFCFFFYPSRLVSLKRWRLCFCQHPTVGSVVLPYIFRYGFMFAHSLRRAQESAR